MKEITEPSFIPVKNDILMLDLMDGGMLRKSAAYLIEAQELTLIETGPGPSGELILKALKNRGYAPEDLKYVIVTHVHLDHAGAAGYLLNRCSAAKLVVHPRGARHMMDPTRLEAGARQVYENFDELFYPIEPVPQERIIAMEDAGILDIGERELMFLHGEGHAKHHFTVYDETSRGIFAGDMLGIYFPRLAEMSIPYCLPSTSPVQFDPEGCEVSLQRLAQLPLEKIFFTHFGVADSNMGEYFKIFRQLLEIHQKVADQVCLNSKEPSWQEIAAELEIAVREDLIRRGFPKDLPLPEEIRSHFKLNAQGLLIWKGAFS